MSARGIAIEEHLEPAESLVRAGPVKKMIGGRTVTALEKMNEIQNQEQPSKKERREMKRLEKEKEIQQARRQRGFSKLLKWLIVLIIAAAAIFLLAKFFSRQKENLPGVRFEELPRFHIQVGQEHPPYNSNPPTSGWHWATPAQTGIYDQELPDEQVIHNLEHSHVWISYHPDLVDQQTIEKLTDIAKDFGSKIIMTPRSANDSPVAVAAWGYSLKLDTLDRNAIENFIKAHRGKSGPENPPDYDFKDFREK